MQFTRVEEIEHAIQALPAKELAELYAWLDRQRGDESLGGSFGLGVFEEGLGLFGGPEDAALLDEVVRIAIEERHRPSAP